MPVPIAATVAELRRALHPWRGAPGVALVPTMGALHAGHLALVRAAQDRTPHVAVSIFVNPAQFAPGEDFGAYPRTFDADREKLAAARAALIFAPKAEEMYPQGFATTVTVGGPAAGLETDFRPHFFAGVATVVSKLLIAALPDWAMFGEKDYQQLLVVRRLVADLGLPTEIVAVPVMREADGLAMSSRNAYLTPAERAVAGRLNLVMRETIVRLRAGEDIAGREAALAAAILKAGFDSVDYAVVRDAETLAPVGDLARPARLLVAARIGRTRLIDNMAI